MNSSVSGTGRKSRRAAKDGTRRAQKREKVRNLGEGLRHGTTQRSSNTRAPNKTILIVTEDETGGLFYLQDLSYHLGLHTQVEAVSSEYSDPLNVVQQTIKKAKYTTTNKQIAYDDVYCLFDGDVWYRGGKTQARVNQAIDLAQQTTFRKGEKTVPLRALVSTPCFEVFLLLHFRETLPGLYTVQHASGRQSLCLGVERDVDAAMQRAISQRYHKTRRYDFKGVFASRVHDACDRSQQDDRMRQRLRTNPPNPPAPFENPSTQVHDLVAVLLHMAK